MYLSLVLIYMLSVIRLSFVDNHDLLLNYLTKIALTHFKQGIFVGFTVLEKRIENITAFVA